MTQNEKMAIVQNICSSATMGTDCKGLSLKEQATELMKGYGIPTTAKITEIPLYWDNQVSILFTLDGNCQEYELALGASALDGEFFEILCMSESGKELPLDYFVTKHLMENKTRVDFSNGTIFEMPKLTNGIFKLILCELKFAIPHDGGNAQAYIINAITGQIKFIISADNFGFGNIVYTISRPCHRSEFSIVRNTVHRRKDGETQ